MKTAKHLTGMELKRPQQPNIVTSMKSSVDFSTFRMVITDAVLYNISAALNLKNMFPKLFTSSLFDAFTFAGLYSNFRAFTESECHCTTYEMCRNYSKNVCVDVTKI